MKKILIPLLLATATSMGTPNYDSIENTNFPVKNTIEKVVFQDTIKRELDPEEKEEMKMERLRKLVIKYKMSSEETSQRMKEKDTVYHTINPLDTAYMENILKRLGNLYYNTGKKEGHIFRLNPGLDISSLELGDSVRIK